MLATEEIKTPVEIEQETTFSQTEWNRFHHLDDEDYDLGDGMLVVHGDDAQVAEMMSSFAAYYAEVQNPENTAVNAFFKKPDGSASKYSPLNEVLNATRPVMAKHGLGCIQIPFMDLNRGCCVTTMLTHKSGGYILFPALSSHPENKNNAIQALGACITYLRRFALNGIAGVCGEIDDDGNSQQASGKSSSAPAKEQTPQQKIAALAKVKAKKNRARVAEIIKETAGTDVIKDIPADKLDEVYKKLEELPE